MYTEKNKSVIKVYTEEFYTEGKKTYSTNDVISGKRYAPDDVNNASQARFNVVYETIKKAVSKIDYSRKANKGSALTPKPFTIDVKIDDISNAQLRKMEDQLEKEISDKCGPFGIALEASRDDNEVEVSFYNHRT